MALPIVKIRGVSKSFGKKLVLDGVDLDINEGEIFGVIGASGAGKTTLLHSMVGFIPINKGDISYKIDSSVSNYKSLKQNPDLKKDIGFSTQDPSFYDRLTVRENMEYFATLYNIPKKFIPERIKKILDLVELTGEENSLAGELSGGMQKRLDIACSLINDPKILILDEPTADLDPTLRRHIWQLLKKINLLGKTIIVSSHFLEEMDSLCGRIGLIFDRKMVHSGTPEELRKEYPYAQEIVLHTESQNYSRITSQLKGLPIDKTIVRGNKLVIYSQKADAVLKHLMKIIDADGEHILDLEVQQPSLDEIFMAITNKKGAQ